MSQVQPGKFRCDACGRRFTWRAEIAGREAKCPCGNTVICPEREPGADDDLYDLAPASPLVEMPAVRSTTAPTTAVPVLPLSNPVAKARAPSTPMSGKPVGGRTLGYSTPKIDKSDPADVIQLQAPLLILAGGVCVEMAAAYFQSGLTATFTVQAERLGLNLFFFTGLMLIAVMIAAKRRGINLGPLWPAVIKLAAIAIGPTAAVDLMRPILAIIPGAIPIPGMYISVGTIAGLAMEFVLFFALLGVFFDLDESDTWYCVCVMLIVYAAVYVGLMFLRH